MSKVNPVPAGYHTLTPVANVRGAGELIDFLKTVFGATEVGRHALPDGRIMHAEVRVGDSLLMIGEACGQIPPMPAGCYVYVDDADATYRQAVAAGATSVMEPADMFWGDRFASVQDAWGNVWSIATHIEDVSTVEMDRRARAFAEQFAATT